MRVIKTDEECIINGRTCAGLPVFIRKNGVDWLPADWLKRKFMRGLKPRSVATYAEHLRPLIAHMDESGISWGEIDDEWLEQRFNAHQKTGPRVAPQALQTQLQFLRSLEDTKAVRGLIGAGPNFRIELGPDGQPLWLQKTLAPMTLPSLPSLAAIDSTTAHLAVKDPGLYARNELMMKWQFNAGLRAAEVCGLRRDQLPGRERALELLEQREGIYVTLTVTKGRPARTLKVHPLLVIETLNWMDSDRERLIEAAAAIAQENGQPFEDCGAAFPSSRGSRLSPRSLSNMIRLAFLHAVTAGRIDPSDRVWSHGLRHRGLHEDLRARRAAGQRSAELHAMHHAGHRSLKARQVYVHLDEDADFFPVIDQRART